MKLIERLTFLPKITRATLNLGVPFLLVTAGNYVAFSEQVATTILLDVNPSIEITVNKIDEVIEVMALNEDAETIIEDLDLEGVEVDVAMHIIVGSLVRNGYIDEAKNAVLVTVENEDNAKQLELEAVVTSEISDRLVVSGIAPIIFTQEAAVKKSDIARAKACAKEHNISLNKASFIQKILKENKTLSVSKLVAMNVESLSEVIRAKNINLHGLVGYSEKALTKTSEKTAKKPAKAADTQTASSGKETEKQAKESPPIETQVKATNEQEGANTQLIGQPAVTTIAPPEAQSQVMEQQAAANSNAVEKQAEAEAEAEATEAQIIVAEKRAAERQAEAESKAKEEQLKAAEKQAEAEAKKAEKQAEAEAKEAEKQAEAEAKAEEKQGNGNGNGNSGESRNK